MIAKFLHIVSFLFIMLCSLNAMAQTPYLCQNPQNYNLKKDEVSVANAEFYCWEISYLKKYHNRLSVSMNEYINMFPQPLLVSNINDLRSKGITPEKMEYLQRYFYSPSSKTTDKEIVNSLIEIAKKHLSNKLKYKLGKPIFMTTTVYKQYLRILQFKCIKDFNPYVFTTQFPPALVPVGVIGVSFVNAFGEIMAEIRPTGDPMTLNLAPQNFYLNGTQTPSGQWDTATCPLQNIGNDLKSYMSCISCHIFEISFNTVSRIGYVLYDEIAYYGIALMVGLFCFWLLFVFFDNVIKKQDGWAFIKTFFERVKWVFIIGFLLTVSIKSNDNILNYTLRPLTDFMMDYNKVFTKGIERGPNTFECNYKTKDIKNNEVLFSREVKENIVCTIERISKFNNFNLVIGKYTMSIGIDRLVNFNILTGLRDIILGLGIFLIFFFLNIMIPFYFIESIFNIAIVVFLFPLLLVAYAFEKTKSMTAKAFDTFMAAIFQIVSLTLMCTVISVLMLYVMGLDFYNLSTITQNYNSQEATSQLLYILSFNTNNLLEVFYTGFICWYLIGQAVSIANKYSGISLGGNLQNTFVNWTINIKNYIFTVKREQNRLKNDSSILIDRLKTQAEQRKQKSKAITAIKNNETKDEPDVK